MAKKRIICFGDSNTWGAIPDGVERYDENTRWPMIMQSILGDEYQVLEEGQNGRTISQQDPYEGGTKCGMDYILPMIETHRPFDLLIIMLGTNDLKTRFGVKAEDIAGSMETMLCKAKSWLEWRLGQTQTQILLVAPMQLGEDVMESESIGFLFDGKSVSESKRFTFWYRRIARKYGCGFLDASQVVQASKEDRLHLDPGGHKMLAQAMAEKVKEMLE